jgi:hypothetical protein
VSNGLVWIKTVAARKRAGTYSSDALDEQGRRSRPQAPVHKHESSLKFIKVMVA